jgi:hypothetical protein
MSFNIQRGGRMLPNRVLYYGSPGTAKTTFGAFAPKPLFLLTPGETGLVTLSSYGRVPECDYVECHSYGDVLGALAHLSGTDTGHKTLVVDTANGLERLCFESVCSARYSGSMQKFLDYGKGPEVALPEWRKLFRSLDVVRSLRGMGMILLAHSAVKRIKNPDGDDYDKSTPLIHDKLREDLMQWADITVFARRVLGTKKDGMRVKADFLGDLQLICCEGPTHEAKNRAGLPPVLDVPDGEPASVFGTFAAAMRAARAAGQAGKAAGAAPASPPAAPQPVQATADASTVA